MFGRICAVLPDFFYFFVFFLSVTREMRSCQGENVAPFLRKESLLEDFFLENEKKVPSFGIVPGKKPIGPVFRKNRLYGCQKKQRGGSYRFMFDGLMA